MHDKLSFSNASHARHGAAAECAKCFARVSTSTRRKRISAENNFRRRSESDFKIQFVIRRRVSVRPPFYVSETWKRTAAPGADGRHFIFNLEICFAHRFLPPAPKWIEDLAFGRRAVLLGAKSVGIVYICVGNLPAPATTENWAKKIGN